MDLQAYVITLSTVKVFKYLVQVLTASENDWMVVLDNIWKDRSRWAHLYRFWGKEGEDPRTSVTFYKAVVQETLFFELDIWLMIPRIGNTLVGFHHRVDRCMAVIQPRQDMVGRLE